MAKPATAAAPKPGLVQRVTIFIQEVRTELEKVTWPTMEDLKVSTKVVLMLLFLMAAIIFSYDKVFEFVVVNILRYLT